MASSRLTIVSLFISFTLAREQPWQPSSLNKTWLYNGFVSNNRVNGTNITVLFIKDSITKRWQTDGLDLYIEQYVPLEAANREIGCDSTQDILWRVTDGEVDGIQPRVYILKIGTNNIPKEFTDIAIAGGITAIVNELSEKLPATKLLLVGVLPPKDAATSEITESMNRNVATLDNGNSIKFLNMVNHYIERNGHFYDELYLADSLHENSQGYVKWNEVTWLLFGEMYNTATEPIITGFYLTVLVGLSLTVSNCR